MSQRSICFKGGSTAVGETVAETTASQVAVNEFNDYMTTIRPFENKFIADVSAPTAAREAAVAGRVNGEIAQKVGTPTINPNRGMDPNSVTDVATTAANAQVDANLAVKAQKAAGLQSVIDIGRGKANSAQLGMSGLASQSVTKASNDALNTRNTKNSNMSAGATGIAIAAGMSKNLYSDSTKKEVTT
jgi:hypothetical protein